MTKNVGTADRIIRSVAALVLLFLILTGTVEGPLVVILGIVAAALLVTSALSVCPAYLALKLSTLSGPKAKH